MEEKKMMTMTMKRSSYEAVVTSSPSKNWSLLPDDVLIKILQKLNFLDCLRAILSCRGWKIQIPATSRCFLPWTIEQHWSMITISSKKYISCTAKLHQPHNPELYSLVYRTFDLPCCRGNVVEICSPRFPIVPLVRETKLGWLLVEIPHTGLLVLYNPFVNYDDDHARVLPPLNMMSKNNVIYQATFSCPPTSSDCVVFAVTKEPREEFATIHTWCCDGGNVWKQHNGPELDYYLYSAVAVDHTLYCLERSKHMIIFNSTNSALKIVSTPIILGGYLAAVNGCEVLLVHDKFSFEVYRYDMVADSWELKPRLDGQALFLDCRDQYRAYAVPAEMDNRIYDVFKLIGEESYYCYVDRKWKTDSSGRFMFPSYHQKQLRWGDDFISMV